MLKLKNSTIDLLVTSLNHRDLYPSELYQKIAEANEKQFRWFEALFCNSKRVELNETEIMMILGALNIARDSTQRHDFFQALTDALNDIAEAVKQIKG